MVLHLNPALQANPPAGVPCILGWGLDCARASYQPLHLDQGLGLRVKSYLKERLGQTLICGV